MCFLLQQANTNKYTLIIILYYYFMIDLKKYTYMLQCYTCYKCYGIHPTKKTPSQDSDLRRRFLYFFFMTSSTVLIMF